MSSDRAKAKEHINSFRAARGLPDNDVIDASNLNLADLAGALTLTSSQLYADQFHFIWEIIQNNDDADYDNQQAQLNIALTDDTLYAWSNQTGFRKADVDSICGIGRSSKVSNAETIGEKGIGFKSLFTIADRVVIRSEPYHFKFDTTTKALGILGMIVPTWIEESDATISKSIAPEEGTLVSLHLKPHVDVKSLRDKLEGLDFSFLIFCRRLKKIQVSYTGTKAAEFLKLGELRGQTDDTVTLWSKKSKYAQPKTRNFRLFSNELTHMPQQVERSQQGTSTIRLAFMLPKDWTKGLTDEMTYAFMPMKRFGFNFMIHANFILTANRGEVIQGHEWNKKLRNGLADLIHSAILWFATSTHSPIKFQWPEYVRSLDSVHDSFFKPLAVQIRERLRSTPLLVTDADDAAFFQTPEKASLIPGEFRHDGKLILNGNAMACKSVNQNYAKDLATSHALELLGVKKFGYHDFLTEFKHMVQNETREFRSRPLPWHASVAAVLLASRQVFQSELYSVCRELDIIPLKSGQWVAPKTPNLFLAGEDMQDVPLVLTVQIVDSAACADTSRSLLFEILGVKACTRHQICEAIVEDHRINERDSISDTVAEMKFLFLSNYRLRATDQFQIFYEDSTMEYAEDTDIHIQFGKIGRTIQKQLGPAGAHLTWLHEDYGKIPNHSQLEGFVHWLQQWPGLNLWPEVCRDHELTPAMVNLQSSQGSKALLTHFLFRVKNGILLPFEDEVWKHRVCNLKVSTNQGPKKLCETALPEIAKASEGIIPGLDISEPKDPDWLFLGEFGVVIKADARFPLQKLRRLRSLEHIASIDEKVAQLYFDLGKLTDDAALIREAFKSENLIYLGASQWVKPESCRWKAKYHCTAFHVLSETYDRCKPLFKDILRLKTADLNDLLKEYHTDAMGTARVDLDDNKSRTIYQLLLDMNAMLLHYPANAKQKTEMKKLHIFPIETPTSGSGRRSMRLMKPTDHFWIGDIPWVQKRFIGKVPLLLPIFGSTIKDLDAVFKTLEMDQMRLNRGVFVELASDGTSGSTDERLKRWLQPKIPYIISLLQYVEETRGNRKEFIAQLSNLQVQRVRGIKIRRFVKYGQQRTYATDEEGEICIKAGANELTVHVDPELREPEIFEALAEHLSKHWNLQSKNPQLLSKVLISSSPDRYIEALERAGVVVPDGLEANGQPAEDFRGDRTAFSRTNGNVQATGSRSSRYGDQDDPMPISDDDAIAKTPTRITHNHGAGLHASSAVTTRWTGPSTNSCLTDETSFQYKSFVDGERSYNYRYTGGAHFSDIEMSDAYSTSSYRSRTRSATSSMQDGSSSLLSASPQSHVGYNSTGGPWKKRKLETETSSSTQGEELTHEIGREGERLVYDFLCRTLESSFSHLNWTSRNRDVLFPTQPFMGEEADYSDFTYRDSQRKLCDYLVANVPGYKAPPESVRLTYHLEVKTSLDSINVPAVLSNNQIRMARHFSKHNRTEEATRQDDEYVLVRVYNLGKGDGSAPRTCFYPDPWDLICRGILAVEGDEGLYVRPM